MVAIFPEDHRFYRAMVSKAPKRGPGGSPPREVVLKFEDDEDDSGGRRIGECRCAMCCESRPKQKHQDRPRPRPPPQPKTTEPQPATAAPLPTPRPRGRCRPTRQVAAAGGRGRGRAARRRDLLRHDRPRPEEAARRARRLQGHLQGHRADDFFEQLNWKLESDLRERRRSGSRRCARSSLERALPPGRARRTRTSSRCSRDASSFFNFSGAGLCYGALHPTVGRRGDCARVQRGVSFC